MAVVVGHVLGQGRLQVSSSEHERPVQALSAQRPHQALGVGVRCDEQGEDNVVGPLLERLGYRLERAKTNVGLGRITNLPEPSQKEPVAVTQ